MGSAIFFLDSEIYIFFILYYLSQLFSNRKFTFVFGNLLFQKKCFCNFFLVRKFTFRVRQFIYRNRKFAFRVRNFLFRVRKFKFRVRKIPIQFLQLKFTYFVRNFLFFYKKHKNFFHLFVLNFLFIYSEICIYFYRKFLTTFSETFPVLDRKFDLFIRKFVFISTENF